MSLLDTIKAARDEAEEAGTLPTGRKDGAGAPDSENAEGEGVAQGGFSRRSAARAKPTREAAGTVRTTAKASSEMTKEEKKAARQQQRSDEDLAYEAKRALLNARADYRMTQRVWWGLLIAGIVCTLGSWGAMRYMQSTGVEISQLTIASVALMVAAYVLIIGAFVYDLVKTRPIRKEVDAKLAGMSKRRMRQVVADEQERKAAEKAAKK